MLPKHGDIGGVFGEGRSRQKPAVSAELGLPVKMRLQSAERATIDQ